jgi:hypothetical protein
MIEYRTPGTGNAVRPRLVRWAILTASLFVLGLFPLPEVSFYFGHRPQWVFAIEVPAYVAIGPIFSPRRINVALVIGAKLAVIVLPVWAVHRWRSRRSRPAATGDSQKRPPGQ